MPHIVTLRAMLVPHRIPPFTITLCLWCYFLQHADGITFQSTICSNAIRPVLTFDTVRATKTVTACITTSPFLFLHPASKTGFTRFHILGGTLNFSAIFTTFQFCPVCCSFAPSPTRSSLFFFVCLFVFQSEATTERENTRTVHRPPKAAPFAAAWSKAESTEPPKRRPTMRVISKQATYVQQHRRSLASQEHLGSRSQAGEIRGTSRKSGRPGSPGPHWLPQSCCGVVKHAQERLG